MLLFAGLAIFGVAFAALFPVARRLHDAVERRGIARGFVIGLIGLVIAFVPLSRLLAKASDRLREHRLDAAARDVRPVLDAVSKGAVGPLDESSPGSTLLALLRGRDVRRMPRIQYSPLELGQAGAERLSAEGNFPFRLIHRQIGPGETLRFPVDNLGRLTRLGFALPPEVEGLTPTLDVWLVKRNGERRELVLDSGATRFHGWGEGAQMVEVRQLDVVPAEDGVAAVDVRPRGMRTPIHGVCGFDGFRSKALTPQGLTRSGLPVRWIASPQGRGIPVAPGGPPVELTLDTPVDCDRLWLVYEAGDPKAAEYRWFGEDIVDVRLDYADGRPSEQQTLKHGEDLHSSNLDRSRHAEDLKSLVAFVAEEDGVRSHSDQRLWVFSGARKLKRVTLRNLSGSSGYAVSLIGLTAGIVTGDLDSRDAGDSAALFVKEGDTTRLKSEWAARLMGVRLAVADRRGLVRATEVDAGLHLEGSSLEVEDVDTVLAGRSRAAQCGTLVGMDADVAVEPVKIGDVVSGALVLFVPEANRALRRGAFDALPALLALLTLPYFLVTFAESLSRGDRIRRKISIALAVAAVVPLAVVFVLVRGVFESSREHAARQKLGAEMQLLRERLVRERDLATSSAAAFFRAFREHPRVEPLFLPPHRPDAEAILRRELKAARERLALGGRAFVRFESRIPGAGTATWKTIDDASGADVKLDGLDFQGTDYYFIDGRLFLVGVDRWSQGEMRGRLALGAEVRLPVEKAGTTWLLGLDGKLVAEDDLPASLTGLPRQALIDGAIRSNRSVLAGGPGVGLLDVFRDRDGNPGFAYLVYELPTTGEIALLGTRVSLGLLLGLVTVLGAVSAVAVARILTDRFTVPIERLATAAESARSGRAFVPIVTESADEIGLLSEQFQAMSSELVQRVQHLDSIRQGMLGFAGRLNREAVAREACRFAAVAARAKLAMIWLPDPQGKAFRVFDSEGRQRPMKATPLVQRIVASDAWSLVSNTANRSLDFLSDADRGLTGDAAAVWGGAIRLGSREEGWLLLAFERMPDDAQREAGRAAASSIALVLENSRTYELAIEDPLTGAFVAAHFEFRLSEAVERARALGQPLWVVRVTVGPTPSSGSKDLDAGLQGLARRLLRFAARMPGAFVGRSGGTSLTLALSIDGRERRERLEASLRRLAQRQAQRRGLDVRVTQALFPDDAPSAEALAKRLHAGIAELPEATVDLVQFLGTLPASPAMRETATRAARLARVDIAVLLEGEAGVGKLDLARRMHRAAFDTDERRVEANLATIHPNLAEADLFGAEVGAYSGLTARRIGLLEKANDGTLILDEIGETPLDLQGKLLRALQDRKIRRLGGGVEIPLEFRLISTSSRDLKALVRDGGFRQDLFYRIAGAVVNVPPLRARAEDIPALAHAYLASLDASRMVVLTPRAIDRLMAHAWPGNLTELRATLRRALVHVGNRSEIDADDLDIVRVLVPPSPVPETPRESEWRPRVRLPLASPDPELRSRRSVHEHVWNERQKRLLAMLARGDRITTTEYIRLMQVSPRTGLRDLAELVRTGRLRREGRKRGTTYRLA